MRSAVVVWALCLGVSAGFAATVRVEDHGAVGDGVTLNSVAIQAAIDACAAAGGGVVTLGPGRFLCGSLELRSHVTLRLDPAAVLLGSDRLEDYPRHSLLRASGVVDVGLEGGTIDGRGDVWWEKVRTYTGPVWASSAQHEYQAKQRPSFIRFYGCSGVTVRNIRLTGSPSWTLHLKDSTDCLIEGVTIRNPLHGPNTDGIDINSCRRVTVRDCDIITGDDGIVLKSTDPGHGHPCEDITVERCSIWSATNGLKIGTETHDSFRRLRFSDCRLYCGSDNGLEAARAGLAIESVDGSELSDIVAEDLVMDNLKAPLFIRLGHRGGQSRNMQQVEPRVPGRIQQVTIRRIRATRCQFEASITGLMGHPVEDVTLSDLDLSYVGGESDRLALVTVPEDEVVGRYPEATMFGRLPAYGLYCRHVDGLRLDQVALRLEQPDGRPALVCDDVANLTVQGLRPDPPPSPWPALWFINTRAATLTGCTALPGTATFLAAEGPPADAAGIRLVNCDTAAAGQALAEFGPGGVARAALPRIPETAPGLVRIAPGEFVLTGSMAPAEGPDAAPGGALEVARSQRRYGTALARFAVSEAGEYRLWAWAFAPNEESNSYYVAVDDSPQALVDVKRLGQWVWERAEHRGEQGLRFTLTPGEHTLTITNRESGTRLAGFILTTAADPTPAEVWARGR